MYDSLLKPIIPIDFLQNFITKKAGGFEFLLPFCINPIHPIYQKSQKIRNGYVLPILPTALTLYLLLS